MRTHQLTICFLYLGAVGYCQSDSTFIRSRIFDTGASVLMPFEPEWLTEFSEDGSNVYTAEVNQEGLFFGVIVVEFADPFERFDPRMFTLLDNYTNFLNATSFEFDTTFLRVELGLEDTGTTEGGLSYFGRDTDDALTKVTAWVGAHFLAVLYISHLDLNRSGEYHDFFYEVSFPR